jgi:hypothetical protein
MKIKLGRSRYQFFTTTHEATSEQARCFAHVRWFVRFYGNRSTSVMCLPEPGCSSVISTRCPLSPTVSPE